MGSYISIVNNTPDTWVCNVGPDQAALNIAGLAITAVGATAAVLATAGAAAPAAAALTGGGVVSDGDVYVDDDDEVGEEEAANPDGNASVSPGLLRK
ncbi:hypothetical protein PybrP1_006625 [[Pythium] brassicae (nom. inval.)]|nr:hypothetical protein PybrP1_006625 [[Pythium] brassicae (nom. inval.)]